MSNTLPILRLKVDFGIDTQLEKLWVEYYTEDPNTISPLYKEEIL